KQILRSGTSIGANVEEAIGAQSKKDFLNKMSIAYKEARETDYWLRLMNDRGDDYSRLSCKSANLRKRID
ncbi:four helix bundle protein, partial [Patescibacteria group bacterium]|nr:four helix bundle protein [Patescibacteria group bacterium]